MIRPAKKSPKAKASAALAVDSAFAKPSSRTYPIEESLGGTMTQIMRFLNPWLDSVLEEYNLSHGTWFYVRTLWDEDGISQRELSERVGTSGPTTLAALRVLVSLGYVSLAFDTNDRRRNIVRLTDRGRALQNDLIPLVAGLNPKILKGLKKAEVRELFRMLRVIRRNAEANFQSRHSQAKDHAA